jgi:hypothetical protein
MPNLLFGKQNYTKEITQQGELTGEAVTTSDSTDLLNGPCFAINVTSAGNVNVNLAGGGTAVLTGLSAGQTVRINASRILTTSTTATGINALYLACDL